MATSEKVRIVWNGKGGELDSVVVKDDGDHTVSDALVKMVRGNVVLPGDTFTIEEVL